jgi:uncharacterized protein YjbI with pentapeptide repeats
VAGWVNVTEPWARPPRLESASARSRPVAVEGGRVTIEDAELDAQNLDGAELIELTLEASSVTGVALVGVELDARWTSFHACDLSQSRVHRLRGCRIVDSRCTGLDSSDGELTDVVFERCLLNVANLRMTELQRVSFRDCVLTDVDCYEATLTDVSFEMSGIEELSLDRATVTRVDFRGARSLGLRATRSLEGSLVSRDQLQEILYELAFSTGLSVERPER